MYTQILTDVDIYNITFKLIERKFPNLKVLNIGRFEISRKDKIKVKGDVVFKSEHSMWSMEIGATFEDFVCYITTRSDILSYRKLYAEMMVNIINEHGRELELYSEDYKHDYNRFMKHKKDAKIEEAKRHLQEAEQEYEQNIIK